MAGDDKIDQTSSGSEPDKGNMSETTVSMIDILNEETNFEAETTALLGGSDDKHCTYAEVS